MRPYRASLPSAVRHLPNALTFARLLATGVMGVSLLAHHAQLFRWLLLFCLLSDVLDGWLARALQVASEAGAALDSIADIATVFATVLGIFTLERPFVREHFAGLALVLALYLAEVLASLWRYRRVSSFHTLLARTAAVVAGTFVLSLLFTGFQPWLYRVAVLVYTAALVEELVLVFICREWQANVRGAVWLYLEHRRRLGAEAVEAPAVSFTDGSIAP